MNDFFVLLVIFFVILIFLILASLVLSAPKREYGVKSVTAKGEQVGSIAERRIADYFEKNKINYLYEQKQIYSFNFRKFKISFPDFYLYSDIVVMRIWRWYDPLKEERSCLLVIVLHDLFHNSIARARGLVELEAERAKTYL